MKLSYETLVALKTAFQFRLEYLEERIKNAEQINNQNDLAFWTDKHEKLVTAIQNLQEII
jgi:hypothetical protein